MALDEISTLAATPPKSTESRFPYYNGADMCISHGASDSRMGM
jgi:hypothetical protein